MIRLCLLLLKNLRLLQVQTKCLVNMHYTVLREENKLMVHKGMVFSPAVVETHETF
jgi:hypothetical protein